MTAGTSDSIDGLEAALSRLEAQQLEATKSITADRWLAVIGYVALLAGGIGVFTLVYSNFPIALISLLAAVIGWLVSSWSLLKLTRDLKNLRRVQGLIQELQKDLANAWITRMGGAMAHDT